MAENFLFPSLSEDGWVDSSVRTADYMMAHFMAADFSQSYIYAGKVSSFPFILATHHGNMGAILSEVSYVLRSYFSSCFSAVDVTVNEVDTGDSSKGAITIVLNFTDVHGKTYSFAKLVKTLDSKFQEIVNINNG